MIVSVALALCVKVIFQMWGSFRQKYKFKFSFIEGMRAPLNSVNV
jgi:hypothetical protein